ncbi:hypothetical protein BWD10_10185 [Neisseria zoodegmatis]|uniref:Uncharacterized protein n=1 Tax=Neisseria zoodegmatis TaxID=326523 RepID=A0ABX3WDH5_9NEIS|nr:hypothetical protein BWD10_10185 [Neisseria zoodegmatis]
MTKKTLIALAHTLALSAVPIVAPPPVRLCRQHPSIRYGKSGVSANKRTARKMRNRRKAK